MIALLQRVRSAFLIEKDTGKEVARIGRGVVVLLGVRKGDREEKAIALARKIPQLRIFEDQSSKMNLSLLEVGGEIIVVSQFTLCADIRKGTRPSFREAEEKGKARVLYERFIERMRYQGVPIKAGVFGDSLIVGIENDGPVTLILEE